MTLPLSPSRSHATPVVALEVLFRVGPRHCTVTINDVSYPQGRRKLQAARYVRLAVKPADLVEEIEARVEQLCNELLAQLLYQREE